MEIEREEFIALGSLVLSLKGLHNLDYCSEKDSVHTSVVNTSINELMYDHHIITVGCNKDKVRKIHREVCDLFEKHADSRVIEDDRYTMEYMDNVIEHFKNKEDERTFINKGGLS